MGVPDRLQRFEAAKISGLPIVIAQTIGSPRQTCNE